SRSVPEAAREQQSLLLDVSRCLSAKLSSLQDSQRHLRGLQRQASEAQQRLQVEVKMAILQVMRELNKRGKVLLGEAQKVTEKVTEAWQEELERRLRALSELQKHHELVMCFVSRAMFTSRGAALLLSHRL
ncbi:transcription intermediary factor 1-beta-like, partial [Neopelma chrysocephalum]|uniref:transcription intermediary factor 1-beta-like n=1 Tax=Neopelma chrysocephalum TaxID=114329 RepID=UPI000FCD126B